MTTYKVEFSAIICSECTGSYGGTSEQTNGRHWGLGSLVQLNAEDAASLLAQGAISVVASDAPGSPQSDPVDVSASLPEPEPETASEPAPAPKPAAAVPTRVRR